MVTVTTKMCKNRDQIEKEVNYQNNVISYTVKFFFTEAQAIANCSKLTLEKVTSQQLQQKLNKNWQVNKLTIYKKRQNCTYCSNSDNNPEYENRGCVDRLAEHTHGNPIMFIENTCLSANAPKEYYYVEYPDTIKFCNQTYKKFGRIFFKPHHFTGECYISRNEIYEFDSMVGGRISNDLEILNKKYTSKEWQSNKLQSWVLYLHINLWE